MFEMKYPIRAKYLTKGSKKRPGNKISPKFCVVHDTGNSGSTANGNVSYYARVENESYASAHLFVDDKEIIECVPALTATPERAYHVVYNTEVDDRLMGADSNDAAIGVELCFGGKLDNEEAYKRFVWVVAYICYKFKMNPAKDVVGHKILDPGRKIDPHNGLSKMGKTYSQLLHDIVAEYNECTGKEVANVEPVKVKAAAATYKVKKGDSLWGIANQHGTDVKTLTDLNPGVDPRTLEVGKVLRLKATAKAVVKAVPYPGLLKEGSRGRYVTQVQAKLGAAQDGIYGRNTKRLVVTFQQKKKLAADGIVGPATWKALFG